MADHSEAGRLTYFGTVDDVVLRYPWGWGQRLSGDFVNRTIFESVVLGDVLWINDGYLLQSEPLAQALLRVDSPLRAALEHGQARVLHRSPDALDLYDMAMRMADEGIASYRHLVGEPTWDSRKTDLGAVSSRLRSQADRWPPVHTGWAFESLVWHALEAQPGDLGLSPPVARRFERTAQRFLAEMQDDKGRPRDKWEAIVLSGEGADESRHFADSELMRFANQVYHLAFGLCTAAFYPDRQCGVESTLAPAFRDFCLRFHSIPTRELRVQSVPTSRRVLIDAFFDYESGDLVAERDNFRRARLEAMEGRKAVGTADDATQVYAEALDRFFTKAKERYPDVFYGPAIESTRRWVGEGTGVVGGLISAPLSKLGSTLTKAGFRWVLNWPRFKTLEGRVMPKLIELFRADGPTPPDGVSLQNSEIRYLESGAVPMQVTIDHAAAASFVRRLPDEAFIGERPPHLAGAAGETHPENA